MSAHTDTDPSTIDMDLAPIECRRRGYGRFDLWLPSSGVVAVKDVCPIRDSSARDRLRVKLCVTRGPLQPRDPASLLLLADVIAEWAALGLRASDVVLHGDARLRIDGPAGIRTTFLMADSVRAETKLVAEREWLGYVVELRRPFNASELAKWLTRGASALKQQADIEARVARTGWSAAL